MFFGPSPSKWLQTSIDWYAVLGRMTEIQILNVKPKKVDRVALLSMIQLVLKSGVLTIKPLEGLIIVYNFKKD